MVMFNALHRRVSWLNVASDRSFRNEDHLKNWNFYVYHPAKTGGGLHLTDFTASVEREDESVSLLFSSNKCLHGEKVATAALSNVAPDKQITGERKRDEHRAL